MAYIISKYDAPVTIIFDDVVYDMYPEDCHINEAPMTGAVFNIDNVEVQKLLKYLTQETKAWKCIEKSKGGSYSMKDLRDNYNGSSKGERSTNITKADLKELYFKLLHVLPFEKYVNRIK